ncbi:MAG: glycosyltransferase [Planctomycetota bacterium]
MWQASNVIVAQLNSLLSGGAATAARRLHGQLRRLGVDSRFLYRTGEAQTELDDSYLAAQWSGSTLQKSLDTIGYRLQRQRWKRRLNKDGSNEYFSSPRSNPRTPWPPANFPPGQQPEILNLHWVAKFIDVPSFFASLPTGQPVVWTLHDMNPLTGGCHFSDGCTRFQQGCGNCPQLTSPKPIDQTSAAFALKQRALEGVELHVVAPSRWLAQTARDSPLLGSAARSVHHIPYGIDAAEFFPEDSAAARDQLGLRQDAFVIAFGAADLSNRRKGAKPLLQALGSLADSPRVQCIVFGGGEVPTASHPLPPICSAGYLDSAAKKRQVFAASNLFVLPSLEDNLPLTGLESLACGTPIVGFAAGGIPDYVRVGQTGRLAITGDASDLAGQLSWMIEHPSAAADMGRAARQMVLREYTGEREASAYRSLYEQLSARRCEPQRAA